MLVTMASARSAIAWAAGPGGGRNGRPRPGRRCRHVAPVGDLDHSRAGPRVRPGSRGSVTITARASALAASVASTSLMATPIGISVTGSIFVGSQHGPEIGEHEARGQLTYAGSGS